ncbi:MAG: hypothetical protein COV01_01105 [Candidatus Taylorbacteria bacterium CG10_big_fil_rev_8_21_14_0_10_41_48]|uniref:VanZ-like domain-containing protein n=1 Tax=Candidatus Taylorbacteria bacterium CG10_big_fil_rev_8_21_14_0_10_41_48 TaxID=1975024 RepID=A0A2M8LDA2_9BACT|nr:MAG: hypothetical protein COV01_01105 [Candidatus Taylorbacteria bacterium CG10_big_fil_rev_8_21_14_0_10_41_48]
MKVIKFISIVILGILFSYFTFRFFGYLYIKVFNPVGSWLDFSELYGLPIAYLFFVLFLTPLFFLRPNKWLFVILSIPAIAFEIIFDPFHIYFPFIFGFIGLGLGLLARHIYTRYQIK